MSEGSDLKVALVHDWLVSSGGGERVLKVFHNMFPDAPIYTLVYDETKAPAWTRDCDIRTTYIQKWPGAKSHHKLLLSFMPKAWEALDLSEYDLVLSSCSSCCKGVITGPETLHVCYCHSPIRYVWDLYYEYLGSSGVIKQAAMKKMIHNVRMWDYLAAQRVDAFVANSDFVGKRISKFYRRDSVTVHPSGLLYEGDVQDEPDDYYLVVSRFVKYKRNDLAIEACNELGKRLIVVGSGGEDEKRLHEIAGPTIEFKGSVSDEELVELYKGARALLFPGLEDFGLTPVEAMSAGCPVFAYGKGGALETVVNGETGLLFDSQDVQSLAQCIEKSERKPLLKTRKEIQAYAKSFSEDAFKAKMMDLIAEQFMER